LVQWAGEISLSSVVGYHFQSDKNNIKTRDCQDEQNNDFKAAAGLICKI